MAKDSYSYDWLVQHPVGLKQDKYKRKGILADIEQRLGALFNSQMRYYQYTVKPTEWLFKSFTAATGDFIEFEPLLDSFQVQADLISKTKLNSCDIEAWIQLINFQEHM